MADSQAINVTPASPGVPQLRTSVIVVGIESYRLTNSALPPARVQACDFLTYLTSLAVKPDRIRCLMSPSALLSNCTPPINGYSNTEATHDEVLSVFTEELPTWDGDVLVVFWCGHGLINQDGNRRLFVANAGDKNYLTIDVDSLLGFLESPDVKFKQQIIIIDACASWDLWMGARNLKGSHFSWRLGNDFNKQFVIFSVTKGQFTTFQGGKSLFYDSFTQCLANQTLAPETVQEIANNTRNLIINSAKSGNTRHIPTIWRKNWSQDVTLDNDLFNAMLSAIERPSDDDSHSQILTRAFFYAFTHEDRVVPTGKLLKNARELSKEIDNPDLVELVKRGETIQRQRFYHYSMLAMIVLVVVTVIGFTINAVAYAPVKKKAADQFVYAVEAANEFPEVANSVKSKESWRVSDRQLIAALQTRVAELQREEPSLPDEMLYHLAEHKKTGNIIVALHKIGNDSALFFALTDLKRPTVRSHLIKALSEVDNITEIISLLSKARKAKLSAVGQQAILCALGRANNLLTLRTIDFENSKFDAWLIETLKTEKSPEIHAAAEWLCKMLAQDDEWTNLKTQLSGVTYPANAKWIVTPQGHTLIAFGPNNEFIMGGDNRNRKSGDAPVHKRRIQHAFYVGSHECTTGQYCEFVDSEVERYKNEPSKAPQKPSYQAASPHKFQPIQGISWDEAARYCNWLSELAQLEKCYDEIEGQDSSGNPLIVIKVAHHSCERNGYRLPTEAEWEFACRSSTTTARFSGNETSLTSLFACVGSRRPSRVGSFWPNPGGFFDMFGNVSEWCHNDFVQFEVYHEAAPVDDICVETADGARVIRGGSYRSAPANVLSAARQPWVTGLGNQRDDLGFRVARTIKSAE